MENEILKGAYSAEEFADEIEELRQTGLLPGASIGWPTLDMHYTIPRGQWSVVTGLSSSGKSTWLDNALILLAINHGWKFLICSPENQPIKRHIAGLMEIFSGRMFGKVDREKRPNVPDKAYMTDAQYDEAYAFVCKHFYFINPPDVDFTLDGIERIARKVRETFEFDGMVLDPYNQIEHKRPRHLTETDYIATVIQDIQSFTRELNIHFWFVAHPTKPVRASVKYSSTEVEDARKPIYQKITLFDISGSSNWKSQCDFGLIVHRDMNDLSSPSIIEIEKIRFRENGQMGEVPLFYDYLCGRYVESYDKLLFNRL